MQWRKFNKTISIIPAKAGIQWHVSAYFPYHMRGITVEGACAPLDSRLRGNDGGVC
jgi:hypothetical protein